MIATEVCSLRDRGEPEERDVLCTRPGPWGNPFTLERYGWRCLDLYHCSLRSTVAVAERHPNRLQSGRFLDALRALAGKRLLCACPADSLAWHAWMLADVVRELTGVSVKPAPGRER